MKNKYLWVLLLLPLVVFSRMSYANTHEAKPNSLANTWVIIAKRGEEQAFEKAFKAHLKFRQSKGDIRSWKTYVPTVGSNLTGYYVRYCCIKWADADAYIEWNNKNKIGEHWNNNVDKYVKKYRHFYNEIDMENSHWPKEHKFKYFGVTHYDIKMGHFSGVSQYKKKLSDNAKAMNWPYAWSWSNTVGGSGGLNLVVGYENYAGMAPPEKNFFEALAEHLKSKEKAQEMLQAWSKNFNDTEYTVYQLNEELSMKD